MRDDSVWLMPPQRVGLYYIRTFITKDEESLSLRAGIYGMEDEVISD